MTPHALPVASTEAAPLSPESQAVSERIFADSMEERRFFVASRCDQNALASHRAALLRSSQNGLPSRKGAQRGLGV